MTGTAVSPFGAGFVGQFTSTILFGVTLMQAWNYYWNYRSRDPKTLTVFIAILVGLDTLHTVLCFYMFYWYLILNYGNPDSVQFNMWSMNIQGSIAGFMSFLVQLFYARRAYLLSERIIFPVLIVVAASTMLVATILDGIKEFAVKRFALYGSFTWAACLGLGSTLAADILIALSMCWFLYRKRTGFARTDSAIMSLVSYSISSGLLTSIIAIGTVIAYLAQNTTLLSDAFYWTLVKFHVNSLLAMLNSRNSILERSANRHPQNTFYMDSFATQQQKELSQQSQSTSRPTAISVSMHQTTTTDFAPCKHNYNAEPELLDVERSDGLNSTDLGTQRSKLTSIV